MRVLWYVASGLLLLGLAGFAQADSHEDLRQEVQAIGDALEKALLANDVETLLGMYAEDAVSLPNYGPRMEGMETFRQHHEQRQASGMKILSFESDPTDVWGCGDQVIEIGAFQLEIEVPGMPEPIEDKGKYMTVYVRDDEGNLKIKAEIWNTDLNPMDMVGHDHGHDSHHGDDHGHDHDHGHEGQQ